MILKQEEAKKGLVGFQLRKKEKVSNLLGN